MVLIKFAAAAEARRPPGGGRGELFQRPSSFFDQGFRTLPPTVQATYDIGCPPARAMLDRRMGGDLRSSSVAEERSRLTQGEATDEAGILSRAMRAPPRWGRRRRARIVNPGSATAAKALRSLFSVRERRSVGLAEVLGRLL